MTPDELIAQKMTAFTKAKADMAVVDKTLAVADTALSAAKTDVQVGAPARAKAVIADANAAYYAASMDRENKFQASIDAHSVTNQAQADLNAAIAASLQTPAVEAV